MEYRQSPNINIILVLAVLTSVTLPQLPFFRLGTTECCYTTGIILYTQYYVALFFVHDVPAIAPSTLLKATWEWLHACGHGIAQVPVRRALHAL